MSLEEQLETLDATASSVLDLAAPWELDLLLVDAEPLAQVIRQECRARREVLAGQSNKRIGDICWHREK